jgi:hypothetical protein
VIDSWRGAVDRLEISQGSAVAEYRLHFQDGTTVALNELIGTGLVFEFLGEIVCTYCGKSGRRSFGRGYCYDCFSTLARCDLCVVSPDRCHYDKGTCREPEWGESFCMSPHTVYLANSSGLKVGITRRGREVGRWLDQGAIQGLPILAAETRKAAGLAEVVIATIYPDRTDWRKMLQSDVPELDLEAAADSLEGRGLELPDGVARVPDAEVVRLNYPRGPDNAVLERLKLENGKIEGNLLGMKGQYLVLSNGALNLGHYTGYEMVLSVTEPFENHDRGEQLGLF